MGFILKFGGGVRGGAMGVGINFDAGVFKKKTWDEGGMPLQFYKQHQTEI